MAHDTHFLSRLQRLDDPRQLDVALALYRDPVTVRFLLARATIPDAADRVALALTERPGGPHIIVARDGGFVTCLADGMHIGDRPRIARAQIDAALDETALYDRAGARVAWRGGLVELMKRVLDAGYRLAREDFEAAQVLAPLMAPVLTEAMLLTNQDLDRFYPLLTPRALRRARRGGDLLKTYARSHATLGTVLLLSEPWLGAMRDDDVPTEKIAGALRAALCAGESFTLLRATCLAARLGPRLLDGYAHFWRAAAHHHSALHPLPAIAAIGMRHPEHRAEVDALLADRSAPLFNSPREAALTGPIADELRALLADPAAAERATRQATRDAFSDAVLTRYAEQPDDVIDAFIGSSVGSLLVPQLVRPSVAQLIAWAARRQPTDFYMPAATLGSLAAALDLERIARGLELFAAYYHLGRPATRDTPRPGRNDPCPCGSGQKYKRCCALTR